MKILDLGCHDGFVSMWVAKQIREADESIDLHIDGIDANSHAVEIFNRRLDELGVDGKAVVGLAESATTSFQPGTYDAVVAFEIIEHVPDVEEFLWVCEAMCKPGGRVYISTPDGTFGQGQNPHHLRVYRSIDLCELLRRRGTIEDARSGPDGLSFVAYTPTHERKPELAIFCGPAWKAWHPANMEMPGGLGGSETAAVRLAGQLAKDYTVTVYGEFEEQGIFAQVALRHHTLYDPMDPVDVLIVSRMPGLVDADPRADVKLLWMHDTDYGDHLTAERAEKYDAILVLSEWHYGHVTRTYPFAQPKLKIVRNGIHPAYFTQVPSDHPRHAHHALFSSSPDRGLDFLLRIWPKVVEHVPDATLHYCYADVYKAVADSGARPEVAAHQKLCEELAEQLGDRAVNLGALPQPALVGVMHEMGLWLHPSWNTPHDMAFHETFCIGAVESMLAGCVRLMSGWGALPERAGEGHNSFLVGPTHDHLDEDAWVMAIVQQMKHPAPRTVYSEADMQPFSWAFAAQGFRSLIGYTSDATAAYA